MEHTLNETKVTLTANTYDSLGRPSAKALHGSATNKVTYTYNIHNWLTGNQLNRVDDAVTSTAYNSGFEFKNGASAAGEYAYDVNGNLTKNLNKGITAIQYNCLNLPNTVSFSDGSTITYTYAADGTKLRTVHKINNSAECKKEQSVANQL